MIRAIAKGTILFGFGRLPGGAKLYRHLTRATLGTQATHIDKLSRVWPGYAAAWRQKCGLDLNNKVLWMHEGGWTPFPFLMGYLLTGRGTVVTNCEGEVQDRYASKAVEAALDLTFPAGFVAEDRIEKVRSLIAQDLSSQQVIDALGGQCSLTSIPPRSLSRMPV